MFKEPKSSYALDQISSAKPEIMEALILTAILTLIVSRKVLSVIQLAYPEKVKRMTTLRWSNVFAVGAYRTLEGVLVEAGRDPDAFGILEFYMAEVIDPNVTRERLIDPWTHMSRSNPQFPVLVSLTIKYQSTLHMIFGF